jgi:YebC/PmpR family DNA-binding regulatory protein
MSGHSKWHNIQAHKGKQDALKANAFTKLAKGITLAAQKGADPSTNFSLRLLIDKAKVAGMGKDNIDRAIKRGTGELAEGARMEEILYEGFGPGKVAVLIKAITNNRNRTFPDLKHIMNEYGGTVGSEGSVQWMFDHVGLIIVPAEKITNRDDFELQAIDAGAKDITTENEEIVITTSIESFQKVLMAIKGLSIEPTRAELSWVAKDTVPVPEESRAELEAFFNALDDHDDFENYFTNAG